MADMIEELRTENRRLATQVETTANRIVTIDDR
jgi:hypothetical protein